MSAKTTRLLSSSEFCKPRYDTIPVKMHLQTFLSIPITQKCQILSCDTLVANERYVLENNIGHFTGRPKNILSSSVSLNHHKGTAFDWSGIRLLG